jgi:hypothetical protein
MAIYKTPCPSCLCGEKEMHHRVTEHTKKKLRALRAGACPERSRRVVNVLHHRVTENTEKNLRAFMVKKKCTTDAKY